jgi:hypothetical protein
MMAYFMSLELIRARLEYPVNYVRNMGWFRMAMMHTKLIRMKWVMFFFILQVAGVAQGQVSALVV